MELFHELKRGKYAYDVGELALQYLIAPDAIRATSSLHFHPQCNDGKLFRGLIGAKMAGDTGRNRHTVGGLPIGSRPDAHITTIAN